MIQGREALGYIQQHAGRLRAPLAAVAIALGGGVYGYDRLTHSSIHSDSPTPNEIQSGTLPEAGTVLEQNARELVAQEAGVKVDTLPSLKSIYNNHGLTVLIAEDSKANVTQSRIQHIHLFTELMLADLQRGNTPAELYFPAPYDQNPLQFAVSPNPQRRFIIFADAGIFSAGNNNDNALSDHANLATVVNSGQSAAEHFKNTKDALLRVCAVLQISSKPDAEKIIYKSLGLLLHAELAKAPYETYLKIVDALNVTREGKDLTPLGIVHERYYKTDTTETIG